MKRFVFLATAAALAVALIVATCTPPVDAQDTVTDAIAKALPDKPPVKPKQPRKLLVFSKTAGFRHGSIAVGIRAITMMGDKTGAFKVTATENESVFEPEKLKNFDAVLMLNTTGDCLKPKTGNKDDDGKREAVLKKSLVDFVSSGKGLAGFHAACDTYHNWKDYTQMMGGTFQAHPWNIVTCPIKNLDPKHPVNAVFDAKDFSINDEIYVFKPATGLPTDRRVLLSIDTTKMKNPEKGKREDGFYAISWVANYGKGRNFYCSLGHKDEIYWNPTVLRHYLAGIQYALGDLEADATPTTATPGGPSKKLP